MSLNPLWRLLVDRGLRRGEACGLRWEDVDFETNRLSIRRALIPLGREVHVCEPKTRKGRRVLPLNSATVAAPRQQAARQADDAQQWGAAWADTGYAFTQEDGQPLHPTRVSKAFTDAQKKACRASGCTTCATPAPSCTSRRGSISRWFRNFSATRPSR